MAAMRLILVGLVAFGVCAGTLTASADDKKPSTRRANAKSADESEAPAEKAALSKSEAAEKVLTDKGLKKDDRFFLLDEAAAVDKFKQIKNLYDDYQKATMKSAAIAGYDETLANMQMQQKTFQSQAQMLQSQINQAGSGVPRRARGMVSRNLSGYRQEESMLKNQANQMNQQINAMKSKAPSSNDRKVASLEYEKSRRALSDALKELEPLVTPLTTQYHELALDKSVVEAVATLRHESGTNYKLGPSDDLHAAAKVIKDLKLAPKHSKSHSTAKSSS